MLSDSAIENTVPLRARLLQSSSINAWAIATTPLVCYTAAHLLPGVPSLAEWRELHNLQGALIIVFVFGVPLYLLFTAWFDRMLTTSDCSDEQVETALFVDGFITLGITGVFVVASLGDLTKLLPALYLLVTLLLGQRVRVLWLNSLYSSDDTCSSRQLNRFVAWSYRVVKVYSLALLAFAGTYVVYSITNGFWR